MKSRLFVFMVLIVAWVVVFSGVSEAQRKTRLSVRQTLASLKPGQWVKLEGLVVPKDFSVMCMELNILTGDFHDGDWEMSGIISSIDRKKQEFYVLGLPVKLAKDAELESDSGSLKGVDDLKVGMLVELEGTFLKDGTFMANELEDDSAKLREDPDVKKEFEGMGRVHKVDAGKQTITLMGITFRLTNRTQVMSVIK